MKVRMLTTLGDGDAKRLGMEDADAVENATVDAPDKAAEELFRRHWAVAADSKEAKDLDRLRDRHAAPPAPGFAVPPARAPGIDLKSTPEFEKAPDVKPTPADPEKPKKV